MAEGARLESVFTLTGNLGSNPSLSAIPFSQTIGNKRIASVYADLDLQPERENHA